MPKNTKTKTKIKSEVAPTNDNATPDSTTNSLPILPPPQISSCQEDIKEPIQKYNLSKYEYDLYHEENDIKHRVVQVKRYESSATKNEKWRIFENDKIVCTIDGGACSPQEIDFLRSVDGFNWLIQQFKLGANSTALIRRQLKSKVKK